MEVFLCLLMLLLLILGLLHVRGGVSKEIYFQGTAAESSPRPWRCFQDTNKLHALELVFSTSVEVFPELELFVFKYSSLLHVRGGVSTILGSNAV